MNKPAPRLRKGDIIICLENFDIPGTGVTFTFYKNKRYIVYKYLPLWKESNAWEIRLEGGYIFEQTGFMSEDDIFKKFDCVKYQRKNKLKKINLSIK